MKIYIDGILFLNFAFDFLLLLTTSVILKRNSGVIRLIIAAFVGSLSTLLLFFRITSFWLFVFKIFLGIVMCILAFGFKGRRYVLINSVTFYLLGILLGGFLYYLNVSFSYKHEGLVFYHSGLSVNVIFLMVFSPIIFVFYAWQCRFFRRRGKHYYKVNFKLGNRNFNLNGYLDTGNTLSYMGKPVILTNIRNDFDLKKVMVPYTVIGGGGLLECIDVTVDIPDLGMFDCLLGFSKSLSIDGVDVLLNNKMEECND